MPSTASTPDWKYSFRLMYISQAKMPQVAARAAKYLPRREKISRHDTAINARSYQSTIKGAVTMTSLVPMPSAQQATDAAYHRARCGELRALKKHHSVAR